MSAAAWAGWTSAPAALICTVVAHFGAVEAGMPDVPIYTTSTTADVGAERNWMIMLEGDATEEEVRGISREFSNGQHLHPVQGEIPLVAGSMTERALNGLLKKHKGRVKFAEEDQFSKRIPDMPDTKVPLEQRTSGGRTLSNAYPWGIQYVEADGVRGRGAGVSVYVLDTGIRITHNEFGGRAYAGVDVAASNEWPGFVIACSPFDTTCAYDTHGHGTHCAGTVGASTYGVADGATIVAMKVLNDEGSGYTWWCLLAEQWILTEGSRPAVVSLSLQADFNSFAEQTSIDNLVADGVTVVVAAGNNNQDACNWNPAWIPSAITVGASGGTSGWSWDRSSYSNWGSCVDVYAPGTSVLSTGPHSDTHTRYMTGTSMACPHVSGLAAIMYEAHPRAGSMTAAQRWDLLTATSCTDCVTNDATPIPTTNLVILAPEPPAPAPPPTPALCADDDSRMITLASGAGYTVSGCADVPSYCEHAAFGSTVQATCPATCGLCCADDDAGMIALASGAGYTISGCADVQSFCDHPAFGSAVQTTCPETCGSCTVGERRLADGGPKYDELDYFGELIAPEADELDRTDEPTAVAPPTLAPAAEVGQKMQEFGSSGINLFYP